MNETTVKIGKTAVRNSPCNYVKNGRYARGGLFRFSLLLLFAWCVWGLLLGCAMLPRTTTYSDPESQPRFELSASAIILDTTDGNVFFDGPNGIFYLDNALTIKEPKSVAAYNRNPSRWPEIQGVLTPGTILHASKIEETNNITNISIRLWLTVESGPYKGQKLRTLSFFFIPPALTPLPGPHLTLKSRGTATLEKQASGER